MFLSSLRYGPDSGEADDRFFRILMRTVRSRCGDSTPVGKIQIGTHSFLEPMLLPMDS